MTRAAGACAQSETWIKPSPIRKREWPSIGIIKMQRSQMRSLPRADSAFFSIAQKEEGERASRADDVQDRHVLHEIREDHEREPTQHHFPKMHPLAVNERDKSDGAENQTAE